MLLPFAVSTLFLLPIFYTSSATHIPWSKDPLAGRESSWGHGGEAVSQQDDYIEGGLLLQPAKVRKMSPDEGEMFFPEYWGTSQSSNLEPVERQRIQLAEDGDWANSTATLIQAPFALHEVENMNSQSYFSSFLRSPRSLFAASKRDFHCPGGTSACTGIQRPNSCCPTEQTCQLIADNGNGDVGCCTDGDSCSQQVASCQDTYVSCPGSQGGGCCLPGYSCSGVGCEVHSTATVIVTPMVTAAPLPSTNSSAAAASTMVLTSTHTEISSAISTITSSPSSIHSTTPLKSTTPAPAPVAPVRPTSGDASTSITTTAPTATVTPSQCPTGFYACSAYYHGGCCRIGRDCSETSCPAASSTLALSSNGVIVNNPAATTDAALGQGGCALGWFTCGATGGGGCCPSGYACGESCTATGVNTGGGAIGTAKVAKDNGVSGALARAVDLHFMMFMSVTTLFLY